MAGSGPFNAYVDVPTLLAAAPSIPTGGLLGCNTQLSAATLAGVTALPVLASANCSPSQLVYILDGSNTEIVQASASTPTPDATHITLASATTLPHSAGASVSTAGVQGALAQTILQASGWLEGYCQQGTPGDRGLLSKSRTEKLRMPTTRAYVDSWGSLVVRPRYFPVTAVAALALQYNASASMALDPTQIMLEGTERSFTVPILKAPGGTVGNLALLYGPPVDRGDQGWVNLTYTAGYSWPNLPWDLQSAAIFAAQEFLSYLLNPTGAAIIRQGDMMLVQRQRGSGGKESSIHGLFMSQATILLEPFRQHFI